MGVSFPGESAQYRAARDRLLEQEIELRRATEAVAAARRQLPPGGVVQIECQDFVDRAPVLAATNGDEHFHAPPEISRTKIRGADEILGRTRGNLGWLMFYAAFVAAVAVHAPIGMRTILSETLGLRGTRVDVGVLVLGVVLALWGWRAVFAVFH